MTTMTPPLIDIPMPVTTPRLLIRPAMPGDGAELHAAVSETWAELHRWMPWAKKPDSPEEKEMGVRRAYGAFLAGEDFRMVAIERETGLMAVFTGLHRFDWNIRRMEVGYWARRKFHGQGLVTEAVNALTRYAFAALDARAVCISIAEGNEASRNVAERLNFHHEGCCKFETMTPDGVVRDKHWYSHVSPEELPPLDVRW